VILYPALHRYLSFIAQSISCLFAKFNEVKIDRDTKSKTVLLKNMTSITKSDSEGEEKEDDEISMLSLFIFNDIAHVLEEKVNESDDDTLTDEDEESDDQGAVAYNYSFFHVTFMLVCY
jgi:hypothetical protein